MCEHRKVREDDRAGAARAALIVAAIAIAVGLGACGDSGQTALGRAEFIHKADRICRDAHRRASDVSLKIQALAAARQERRVPEDLYESQAASFTDEFAQIGEDALREIRALGSPTGSDRKLERYLAVAGAESRTFARQAEAIRSDDAKRGEALFERIVRLSERARELASAFGFRSCGGAGGRGR